MNNRLYIETIFRTLSYQNIKFSKRYIQEYISTHPDEPSVLSLVDLFEEFGVKCYPIKLDFEKLSVLDQPFIAVMSSGIPSIAVFVDRIDHEVIYYSGDRDHTISKDVFLQYWSGVIIVIDPIQCQVNITNKSYLIEEKNYKTAGGILLLSIVFLLCFTSFNNFNGIYWAASLLSLLNFFGLGACVAILKVELANNFTYLSNYCSLNSSGNCDRVLSFNSINRSIYSFSELGLIVFSSNLLYLLIGSLYHNSISHLEILLIQYPIFLCVSIYLIYVQVFKVGAICMLCNFIHGILLISFFVLIYYFDLSQFHFDFKYALSLLTTYTISFGTVTILKYFKLWKSKAESTLKSKFELIARSTLMKETLIDLDKPFIAPTYFINVGQMKQEPDILIFLNPLCEPCKHLFMEAIILQRKLSNISIAFAFSTGDALLNQFNRLLFGIKCEGGNEKALEFINNWYSGKFSADKFSNESNNVNLIDEAPAQSEKIISESTSLFNYYNIKETPYVLINRKRMPNRFNLSDYLWFLRSQS